MNNEEDLLVWRICLEYNLIYKKCMWDKLAVQDGDGNGWSQILLTLYQQRSVGFTGACFISEVV